MTGDPSHVTNRLAQFVAGSQWEAIPPEVRCEGIRGLLNFVGCALGGARDEVTDIAVKVLMPVGFHAAVERDRQLRGYYHI